MSTARYRRLMANLPSMAAIVNAFQSGDVQLQVYQQLIEALNEGEEAEARPTTNSRPTRKSTTVAPSLGHDLIEGDSIHAMALE